MLRLNSFLALAVVGTPLIALIACDEPAKSPDQSQRTDVVRPTGVPNNLSDVIFFNTKGPNLLVAKDADALLAMLMALRKAGSGDQAGFAEISALEVDGSLIRIDNGTRGRVIEAFPVIPGTSITTKLVLIRNGPRAGEHVYVLSDQVQVSVVP